MDHAEQPAYKLPLLRRISSWLRPEFEEYLLNDLLCQLWIANQPQGQAETLANIAVVESCEGGGVTIGNASHQLVIGGR